jgi:hypothetical protein
MTRYAIIVAALTVICLATCAWAIEKQAFKYKEDFGTEHLAGCILQYYYYVPCPTFSWFWGFYGWECGDVIGQYFTIGDSPTGVNSPCDPGDCHDMTGFTFMDFAGYGTTYPGLFTVQFEIYCCDEYGCPVGDMLWSSGPIETHSGWNDIAVSPPLVLTDCSIEAGPSRPRFLLAARHTGSDCTYPQWGFDNISGPLDDPSECEMHDLGSLPAIYPRPYTSHYADMHSGWYGIDFQYCPPFGFADGLDTTEDASIYGFVELAWKISIECNGPATDPTSWSRLKSMYR